MTTTKRILDLELLKARFIYSDGRLLYATDISRKMRAGMEAGYEHKERDRNYWRIGIWGEHYQRGQIVYALHNGVFPKKGVRHKDNNSLNDRIENLEIRGPKNWRGKDTKPRKRRS